MSDPASIKSSFESFDGLSRFLRLSFVGEESRELRDHVSALAARIDAAVSIRRSGTDAQAIAQSTHALLNHINEHQQELTALGAAWQGMTELRIYRRTLRKLSQMTLQWQTSLIGADSAESSLFEQFEMQAWRALGDAMLVIDMYEQTDAMVCAALAQPAQSNLTSQPAPSVKPSYLQRLVGFFRLRR